MSLGNGTRSVPPSHIEIVAESLCGWACLRESVLIGGSNVASRRGFEIEDFLQYGFGGNVQILSIRLCCGWSMALRDCQVIYSQFGLAIHQNDHQARRRFVEWAQNEIAVVPDFHKRTLFSDEAHFWLNGYVNKQNCRIRSEANPQVYVKTPLHPEKLTVWCALWAGGILLQKR
ncbi:hypothetical protein TNCV_3830591 [Trichonephila clavipes]|nr:hypothetical protein TNCV_3830591 [Trichonephila clavipes]